MIRRMRIAAGVCLALLGATVAGNAAVTPVKAWVGQALLEHAWAEVRATGRPVRPWSWSDFTPVARIGVPSLGVEAVVLNQASGAAMAWGPGHVAGTARPGHPGLTAVAGHRDTHLSFIARLSPGDEVTLQAAKGGTRRYRVTEAMVVDSRTWRFPAEFDGPSRLALATCWPLDAHQPGPMRLVVLGEEVAG